MRGLVAVFLALAGCLSGCAAALVAVGGSGAPAAAAQAIATISASPLPVAVGMGAGVGVGVAATRATPSGSDDAVVGMSRANVESCAGFHGREREVREDGLEYWTYSRRECRVSVAFKDGYVSTISYSAESSPCSEVLEICRARGR